MSFFKTKIPGLVVFQPKVFGDERGYFYESYNKQLFEKNNIFIDFVQDNESMSRYGVVRGLHFQKGSSVQAKLVRASQGKVLDFVVDVREGSPTYKQWLTILLSAENKTQLLIPRGFAHGFAVVSDFAVFNYKCDNFYDKENDGGVYLFDPELKLDLPISERDAVLSEKDKSQPILSKANPGFIYDSKQFENWESDTIPEKVEVNLSF